MSRREEVEATIESQQALDAGMQLKARGELIRTLADEIDDRDRMIGKLLAIIKPDKHRPSWEYDEYVNACKIVGVEPEPKEPS